MSEQEQMQTRPPIFLLLMTPNNLAKKRKMKQNPHPQHRQSPFQSAFEHSPNEIERSGVRSPRQQSKSKIATVHDIDNI